MTSDPRDVLSRPAPGPDLVLRYGDGPDQVIDVHLPDQRVAAPRVVLLHGGFWRAAYDRVHTRPLADALRREGYVVATPEYRRTPNAQWPQLRDDLVAVRHALGSSLRHTAQERVAPAPYRLVGHSAGGHLALWWAITMGSDVERVVALAPVADLVRAHRDDLDDGAVDALMGGTPAQQSHRYADADVAPRLPVSAPAITVVHGDRDQRVPVEYSRALQVSSFRELAGIEHFGLIDPLSHAWPVVRDALR